MCRSLPEIQRIERTYYTSGVIVVEALRDALELVNKYRELAIVERQRHIGCERRSAEEWIDFRARDSAPAAKAV